MSKAHWGHDAPQQAYSNHFDRPSAPNSGPRAGVDPQYLHPAHGGAAELPHWAMAEQAADHGDTYPGYHAPEAHMAQIDEAQEYPAASRVAAVGGILNYAGAALSIALVVGLGVWGYKLAVRDVTGIPVVRALEGPMRVQPEEPGGQTAAHQGLAVNAVQAVGEASGPAERLVLAPKIEDLEAGDIVADISARADNTMIGGVGAITEVSAPVAAPVDPVAAALAIADQIAAEAQKLSDLPEAEAEEQVAALAPSVPPQQPAAENGVKIIPASVPGVRQSPRPEGRPAALVTAVASRAPAAQTAAVVQDVDPTKIAAGTRLVQLGAFESADIARSEWERLSVRFEDYLGGKSRVIQQAQSGGKTFYRLRAMGFADLADARRFCSVLLAAKAACIPVTTR